MFDWMASVLTVLLLLGLIPVGACLLDQSKGPDARLGMAFATVFLFAPWWILAGILTMVAFARGAFAGIALPGPGRFALVLLVFVLASVCFFLRSGNNGMPSPLDLLTCLVMPVALSLYLAWLLHPSWSEAMPARTAHVLALGLVGVPVLLNIAPLTARAIWTSPEWIAEVRAGMEERRKEAFRQEEERNQELKALRAQLKALPADAPFARLIELMTGDRPEVFRDEVLAAMQARPSFEADLGHLLNRNDSTGAFLLAYHHPKPSAALAPALSGYLERQAAEFKSYKNAYPEIFARDRTGFETSLLAASRVKAAGGDLSGALLKWQSALEEMPDSGTREFLLRQVRSVLKQK